MEIKKTRSERMKEWWASMTPEERLAQRQKFSESKKRRYKLMSPKAKAELNEKRRLGALRYWAGERKEDKEYNQYINIQVCKMRTPEEQQAIDYKKHLALKVKRDMFYEPVMHQREKTPTGVVCSNECL